MNDYIKDKNSIFSNDDYDISIRYCPRCNSENTIESSIRIPKIFALFLTYIFVITKHQCRSCGFQWKDKKPLLLILISGIIDILIISVFITIIYVIFFQ